MKRLSVSLLVGLLLASCQSCPSDSAYLSAREVLNAEVESLPLPQNSQILARYDGISTGKIEACRGVITELLIGSSFSEAEVYQFYRDQFVARGWEVTLDITLDKAPGVTLAKENQRYGLEVSDGYRTSTGLPRNTMDEAEDQFESVVLVVIGYGIYDYAECQEAIERIDAP